MHFHTVGSVVDASTGDPLGRKNGDSSTFSKNSRSSVYRIASGSALSSSSSVSSFNVAFVMLLLLLLLLLDNDDDDVKRKKRSCWCSLRLVLKGAVVVVVVVMSSFKGFFVVLVKVEQLYESSKSSRKSKVDRRLCGYIFIYYVCIKFCLFVV